MFFSIRPLFFLAAALGLFHTALAQESKYPAVKLSGFTQVTAIRNENFDGFIFGLERVRIIAKGGLHPRVEYKLMVDFNNTGVEVDKDGDTPGIIKDAQLTLKLPQRLRLLVGKFKTLIGMEFNVPAYELDFIKRGFGHQTLVFERNVGAMLEAPKLTRLGLGLAAGAFNPGPNNANRIGSAQQGDYTLAGRVSLDPVAGLHAQAYFGLAQTGRPDQSEVRIWGGAFRLSPRHKLAVKGEWLAREDANDVAVDGHTFYVQAGYRLASWVQPILKLERLDLAGDKLDRQDVTFGLNLFLNPENIHQAKIMLNYVRSDFPGRDAIQIQMQGAF